MNDRQIEVLERIYHLLCLMDKSMNPNGDSALLKELLGIIREQSELNYAEFSKSK